MALKENVITAAKIYYNPLGFLIEKISESTANSTNDSNKNQSIEDLQLSARKQELQMQMAEAQAKVAQEIAIAKRIELAEEVEIEEFYDTSGEGNLGLKADAKSVALGASGSGRKVTKRIYKFSGVNLSLADKAEQA
jgi:hypothetical protein